ncbi:MAG: hypothetical protein LBJ00_14425 [Planctomycetaceae bacterium]|jgi:hypothetical protein|nr:hypothetical protein [Planctomycetaceae bacterium]
MTKSFFAFCLAAVASFVIFTNSSIADDKADNAKKSTDKAVEVKVCDAHKTVAPVCNGHHVRRFGKLHLPRIAFPVIKLPRINFGVCDRHTVVQAEEVTPDCCCGKVVLERNIVCGDNFKNVKYVKFPERCLPKRIVEYGKTVDVEP